MILVNHLVAMSCEYYVIYASLYGVCATAAVTMGAVVAVGAVYPDRINRLVVFHSHPSFVVGFLVLVDLVVVIDCKPLNQNIHTHTMKSRSLLCGFII